MMSAGILQELRVAASAVLSGALITLVYDGIRIFRRGIPHGNFWIGAEDLIFWIFTSLWVFSVLYRENDGSLRLYTILAMTGGMFLYHQTVSEPLVRILGGLFHKLVKLLLFPLKKAKIPMRFFGKKLKKWSTGLIMKLRWRKNDGNEDESEKEI